LLDTPGIFNKRALDERLQLPYESTTELIECATAEDDSEDKEEGYMSEDELMAMLNSNTAQPDIDMLSVSDDSDSDHTDSTEPVAMDESLAENTAASAARRLQPVRLYNSLVLWWKWRKQKKTRSLLTGTLHSIQRLTDSTDGMLMLKMPCAMHRRHVRLKHKQYS
jgi:hypothetical protein